MIRNLKRTLRRLSCRARSVFTPAADGPLICASIVRNEVDIIDVWVAHLSAIFDHVLIYNHLSSDGTRERLLELAKRYHNLEIRDYTEPGHHQSAVMTSAFLEVASHTSKGWMFFLDGDEFIFEKGRDELRRELSRYRAAITVRMRWVNVYPVALQSPIQAATEIEGWLEGPCQIHKLAVNLSRAETVTKIIQGNHGALFNRRAPFQKVHLDTIRILHMPIRTDAQIAAKVATGLASNAIATARNSNHSAHWKAMAGLKDLSDVQTHVYNYSNLNTTTGELLRVPPPAPSLSGRLSDHVVLGEKPPGV
jgi:hypothetical protein